MHEVQVSPVLCTQGVHSYRIQYRRKGEVIGSNIKERLNQDAGVIYVTQAGRRNGDLAKGLVRRLRRPTLRKQGRGHDNHMTPNTTLPAKS